MASAHEFSQLAEACNGDLKDVLAAADKVLYLDPTAFNIFQRLELTWRYLQRMTDEAKLLLRQAKENAHDVD